MSPLIFQHRRDAGQQLARALSLHRSQPNTLILALPRGGVPVAYEVATALHLPLDVFLVRKLGVPGHEEWAMGAIASGNMRLLNQEVVAHMGITEAEIEAVTHREQQELERRECAFRDAPTLPDLREKTLLLIDDGLATGATMRVAVQALRQHRPKRLIVAVPVAAPEAYRELEREADEVVCLSTPEPFYAVGQAYGDFTQTEDHEVRQLLTQARSAFSAER